MTHNLKNNSEFNKSYFEALETNPYLPVFWIDARGYIFNVNSAVCNYLGYTREEMLTLNICQIDANADMEKVSSLVDIVRKCKINRFESQHRRKDGAIVDVEIISNYYCINNIEFSFNFVFDNTEKMNQKRELIKSNLELEQLTGHLESMVKEKTRELSLKISELEKSEKTARLNEELFINAFKTSQDAINLNSIDEGIYLTVNDGFCNIMGYTPEEVIGRSSLDLNIWKNPQDRKTLIDSIKKYGFCHNHVADFIKKDGTVVHGLMSASIQEYQGRKVLLNVSKDITKLKQLENELKELNCKLRTRVEEEVAVIRRQQEIIFEQKKLADMGMMINAIAHQWRQPLNIIGLRTQEIADYCREGLVTEQYINEFEQNQMDTVEYLSSTIEDFRTFFKPDDKESEFDVCNVVTALLRLIEIQMLTKGIKAYLSIFDGIKEINMAGIGEFFADSPENTLVKGFKGEFKQVITNLVYNAIFAIEEKYKNSTTKNGFIHIKISKKNRHIDIVIEDNGGGINEDIMPHIFNPYFTTKDEGKGTGLGLYLAKLIIQTHMKGTITAENTEQGARFLISLPEAQ